MVYKRFTALVLNLVENQHVLTVSLEGRFFSRQREVQKAAW